jgi:hypothetical protein
MKQAIFILVVVLAWTQGGLAADRSLSDIGPRTEPVDLQLYQTVYYVSADQGSDKEGSGSREHPWKSVVTALARITGASEARRAAVLVAAGTYDSGTVVMKEWIDLFGGYSPQNWERDIYLHRTILDGLHLRRVVLAADHARIDGFVIQGGMAASHGGGILCWDVSPLISNNVIADNQVLEPAGFDAAHIHQAGNHGGGIACFYNAVPVIRNNIIAGNRTAIGCGGGVAFYGWLRLAGVPEPEMQDDFITGGLQATLKNNIIIGNLSGLNDLQRTRSSSGGGVSCAYEARPLIQNNVIAGNRALGRSDAGGVYCEYFTFPVIEDNWIAGNVSDDDGGGIYAMRSAHPLIRGNYIAGNWTTGGGAGGIRLSKEGRGRIADNVIVHNQSGGGINCTDSWMELENNVIMHNRGGGLTFIQHFTYWPATIVRHNILRDNAEASIIMGANVGEPLLLEGNNLQGKYPGKDNQDRMPAFSVLPLRGQAHWAGFDPVHYSHTLLLAILIERTEHLAGSVIRFGDDWGVIKAAEGNKLTVWANPAVRPTDPVDFEILPSYSAK